MPTNSTNITITLTLRKPDDGPEFVETKIEHNDCGNERLDKMADDFSAVLSFFLEQLKAGRLDGATEQ